MASIGKYTFLIGVLLAVVLGIVAVIYPSALTGTVSIILGILIILGIITGLAHLSAPHTNELLIAIIAIVLMAPMLTDLLNSAAPAVLVLINPIMANLVALFMPIAIIVGLKQIWSIGYSRAK